MDIKKIKKVELHIHLDGSLRPETVYDIVKKDSIELPSYDLEEIKEALIVNKDNQNLTEYLEKFELPSKVMQTKENLRRVTYELVEDLSKENYVYSEIRIAPHQHMRLGLTLEEVVEAIVSGMKEASDNFKTECNLLLCIMRHLSPELGFEIVELADKYKNDGVVGIDLAGDEFNYPVTLFKEVFNKANQLNIPFTIHAGEASGAKSVKDAVEIGAKRIGHGVRSNEDQVTLDLLKERKVCLENCPISNYQTHAIKDFSKYPTIDFLEKGILVNLSTDNRTVSNTNYEKEVEFLNKYINIDENHLRQMNENGIKCAFISDEKKEELLKKL